MKPCFVFLLFILNIYLRVNGEVEYNFFPPPNVVEGTGASSKHESLTPPFGKMPQEFVATTIIPQPYAKEKETKFYKPSKMSDDDFGENSTLVIEKKDMAFLSKSLQVGETYIYEHEVENINILQRGSRLAFKVIQIVLEVDGNETVTFGARIMFQNKSTDCTFEVLLSGEADDDSLRCDADSAVLWGLSKWHLSFYTTNYADDNGDDKQFRQLASLRKRKSQRRTKQTNRRVSSRTKGKRSPIVDMNIDQFISGDLLQITESYDNFNDIIVDQNDDFCGNFQVADQCVTEELAGKCIWLFEYNGCVHVNASIQVHKQESSILKKFVDKSGKVIKAHYRLKNVGALLQAKMKMTKKTLDHANLDFSSVRTSQMKGLNQQKINNDISSSEFDEFFGAGSYSPPSDDTLKTAINNLEMQMQDVSNVLQSSKNSVQATARLQEMNCVPQYVSFGGSDSANDGDGFVCQFTVLRNKLLGGYPTGDIYIGLYSSISIVPKVYSSGTVDLFARFTLDAEFITRSQIFAGSKKFIAGSVTNIFNKNFQLVTQSIPVWPAVFLQLSVTLPASLNLEPQLCSSRLLCIRYGPHLKTSITFTGSVLIGFSVPVVGDIGLKASLIASGTFFDGYFPIQTSFDQQNFCLDVLYSNRGIVLDIILRGSVHPAIKYLVFGFETKCIKIFGKKFCSKVPTVSTETFSYHDFWKKTYRLTSGSERTISSSCRDKPQAAVSTISPTRAPTSARRPINYGDRIYALTTLYSGDFLSNNGYIAIMQNDGNFVVYAPDNRAIWASYTFGRDLRIVMQIDGNLVIYNSNNVAIWATNKFGNKHPYLYLWSDGRIEIWNYNGGDQIFLWTSGVRGASVDFGNTLWAPSTLYTGDRLTNNGYVAIMQSDGNFVVYAPGNRPIFATNTFGTGYRISMQTDGNLVVYTSKWSPVWSTQRFGSRSPYLYLWNTGRLEVWEYNKGSQNRLWFSS